MGIKSYTAKLNKFVGLCKKRVNHKDLSESEERQLEENAMSIFCNHHLATKDITEESVDERLFLIDPRCIAEIENFYAARG